MLKLEEYKKRLSEASQEEMEPLFRELTEFVLEWRLSKKGTIVEMLKPTLVSTSYERMEVVARYPQQEWEVNPLGVMHGGITATIFDNQGGLMAQTLTLGALTPTSYLNISYVAPLMPGDELEMKTVVTHHGKRVINVTGEARAVSDGRLIATAMVGYMVIDHKNKK